MDTGDNGGTGNYSGNGSDNVFFWEIIQEEVWQIIQEEVLGSSSGGNLGASSQYEGRDLEWQETDTDIGKGKSGEWKKPPNGWIFEIQMENMQRTQWCYLYYELLEPTGIDSDRTNI